MKKLFLSTFALASILAVSCDSSDDSAEPGTVTVITPGGRNSSTTPDAAGTAGDNNLDYTKGTPVDISAWTWRTANISASDEATEDLTGELTADRTLDANVVYGLPGSYIVQDGVTLTIPAGTKIIADAGGTDVYIAVLKGGKINIQGTAADPVIMSSENSNTGDWGGLTICGKALTSAGADGTGEATAEVGNFKYGGSDAADNSGSISYLVVRGTGAAINPESEYNGISFYAVGSETIVNNIAVIDGADDGVEFYGGSVNATNLYLENNEDDAIDWTEKWDGTVTNSFILHTQNFSTVVEADKDNGNPKLVNITAVSTVGGTALQFKKASGATITNVSLTGYDKDFDIKDANLFVDDNVIIDGTVVKLK